MSITKLQQYQMSGSLASDISDSIVRSDLVKENRTIADDLNSLRTQVKGILGEGAWTDEQAVSLSQVYAAMHVDGANAEVQGNLSVIGESTLASAIVSDLTESRVVFAGANGALVDDAALTFASNALTVGETGAAGKISVKDANGIDLASMDAWAGYGLVSLKDSSAQETIYLEALTGRGYFGGNGVNGSLVVSNGAWGEVFNVDSSTATATVGANGAAGTVSVKNASGNDAITLESMVGGNNLPTVTIGADGTGHLLVKNGTESGIAMSANHQVDGYAQVDVGLDRRSGVINMYAGDGSSNTGKAVQIHGDGVISVGGLGAPINGLVSIKNSSDAEIARLDATTGESTFASAIVSDLTDTRVVFAGASGALVDDAAFTFGSNTLTVGGPAVGAISLKKESDVETINLDAGSGGAISIQGYPGVNNARIVGGANGYGGMMVLRDANDSLRFYAAADEGISLHNSNGDATVLLSNSTATATIGGPVDGTVSIKNASDAETIKLDGANQWVVVGAKGQPDTAYAQIEPSLLEMYDAFGNRAIQINGGGYDLTIGSPSDSGVRLANYDGDLSASALILGGNGNQSAVLLKTSSGDQAIKLDGATATATLGSASGAPGRLLLKDNNGQATIDLDPWFNTGDGRNAALTLGANYGGNGLLRIGNYDNDIQIKAYASGQGGQFMLFDSPGSTSTISMNGGNGSITIAGAADFNSSLDVAGQVDLAAAGVATSVRGTLAVAEDATFAGNIQVDGDFRVKGSMTYIDTQHVRVEDAFIYLATGSLGTTDSGIVLHGGAGVGMDLAIAQKGGSGEFIFGKGDRQPDGEGSLVGMELVPAKFAGIKLGSAEDALSGSVSISGDNIKVAASAAALVLDDAYRAGSSYSGDFKLASSAAEWTAFQNQYPGKSLLGALGAGGGVGVNFRKKVLTGDNANFSGNTLDIAAAGIGTLRSTAQADADYGLDVYLNGVLLALGAQADYTVPSTSEISFNYAINSDDVLTVIAKNVA